MKLGIIVLRASTKYVANHNSQGYKEFGIVTLVYYTIIQAEKCFSLLTSGFSGIKASSKKS